MWNLTREDLKKFGYLAGISVFASLFHSIVYLPWGPIETGMLPLVTGNFVLRSAPTPTQTGIASLKKTEDGIQINSMAGWSIFVARVPILETCYARFVFKVLSGEKVACEVWNGYPWGKGRSCLVEFHSGWAWKVNYGGPEIPLCEVDPKNEVEVAMAIDFNDFICDIMINGGIFSDLKLYDEPIGPADYCQANLHLIGRVSCLIKSIEVS